MPHVTLLPDARRIELPEGEPIGSVLPPGSIAARVGDELVDLSWVPDGDRVSVYRNDGWADLCLGPHVPSTQAIGVFKLLSVAGAYWRGDETRPQLQRIYGTAWATGEDLEGYLHRLEEAERRDHRKLGQ